MLEAYDTAQEPGSKSGTWVKKVEAVDEKGNSHSGSPSYSPQLSAKPPPPTASIPPSPSPPSLPHSKSVSATSITHMARRPPSTAGSSRPFTSNGARPTTAAGNGAEYDHNPQYTYEPDYDLEEEEEESEDEDVFAFLPPSTAEQQKQQQEQQSQHDYPQTHPADHHSDQVFANSAPSPYITYPSPTFDPYARFPADSVTGVGPSTPHFQYFQPPPQTPPSTDSNNHNTEGDHYRLRRLIPPGAPQYLTCLPPPSLAKCGYLYQEAVWQVRRRVRRIWTWRLGPRGGEVIQRNTTRPLQIR
ncbi:hypothetical protein FPV67DRAFT_1668646 [Lyophyllum atratum]|nr:hypothetical protein FPV67DRAFT_1668646 [Lyophyllum atratum]